MDLGGNMDEYIINNLKRVFEDNRNPVIVKKYVEENFIHKDIIREIRDKAECMDYYTLVDVIYDLNKILEE